jgi:hypothetical protein
MSTATPSGSALQGVILATPKSAQEPNWIEIGHGVESWLTATGLIAAALWAIFVYWLKWSTEREAERELRKREREQRENQVKQQERKLKREQTQIARQINEQFLDDVEVQQVLGILDSEGNATAYTVTDYRDKAASKDYAFNLKKKEHIFALRVDEPVTNVGEIFLRECFDAWFYWMAVIEQYLNNGLIREQDIAYPSDYYVRLLKEDTELYNACTAYISHYRLSPGIGRFLKRFSGPSTGGTTAAAGTP